MLDSQSLLSSDVVVVLTLSLTELTFYKTTLKFTFNHFLISFIPSPQLKCWTHFGFWYLSTRIDSCTLYFY